MNNPEEEWNASLAMKLIRNLWIETDHCTKPITNPGHWFFEISKGGIPKETIINQWELLLTYRLLEPLSEEPPSWHSRKMENAYKPKKTSPMQSGIFTVIE